MHEKVNHSLSRKTSNEVSVMSSMKSQLRTMVQILLMIQSQFEENGCSLLDEGPAEDNGCILSGEVKDTADSFDDPVLVEENGCFLF